MTSASRAHASRGARSIGAASLFSALLLSAAASCGDSQHAVDGTGGSGGKPGCPAVATCPPTAPRFDADVAPILAAHCSPCHFPGGKEEQRLFTDYAHVFPQRGEMLTQLATCAMPPSDAPSPLPTKARETLTAWLSCGAPPD